MSRLIRSVETTQKYKEHRRIYLLNLRYGLSKKDFNKILSSQGNACAICKTIEPGKRGWMVDHDHDTGKVRGILCHKCNAALGMLGKNLDNLKRALNYFMSHSSNGEDTSLRN